MDVVSKASDERELLIQVCLLHIRIVTNSAPGARHDVSLRLHATALQDRNVISLNYFGEVSPYDRKGTSGLALHVVRPVAISFTKYRRINKLFPKPNQG